MTNSWLRSALKGALLPALAAVLAGCGPDDGASDVADGFAARVVRDLRKAEKAFTAACAKNPANADALVGLALTELDLGEIAAAKAALAKAQALAADDVDVRLLTAQIAYAAKDFALAEKTCRALAEDAALPPAVQARGWTGLGIVETTCDDYDRARLALLRAIRLDRRNPAARYHLGRLYRFGFDYPDAALEQFEIFVRLDDKADARVQKVQRSVIPELKEAKQRAAASRPGADRRNPALCQQELEKGDAEAKKGRVKQAHARYVAAVKADALSYPAALALARSWLKFDTTANGQRQALAAYQAACALKPESVSTYLATGDLALRIGAVATAESAYSRALASDPANISAIDGLIRALRRAGGRAKANTANEYQKYRDFIGAMRRAAK